MNALVKPEFGPTLPELLAPRLRRLSAAGRAALAVLAALVAVGILVGVFAAVHKGGTRVAHRSAPQFNFSYASPLRGASPGPGVYYKIEARRGGLFLQSFEVRPLRLPAYAGEPNGELPLFATGYIERLARDVAGFQLVSEGKARINDVPGYSVVYRGRLGTRTVYGRDVLLVPDQTSARSGVVLRLRATPAAGIGLADNVGAQGALKRPLRSFRFGVEGV